MENDRQIGPAWFGPEIDSSDDRWWLWDVTVDEPERGRGVGREVLTLVEAEVRRLRGTSLGLGVSVTTIGRAGCTSARGYEVVSARMRKLL
jgi:GNAT superfamily N-acetyltransferase